MSADPTRITQKWPLPVPQEYRRRAEATILQGAFQAASRNVALRRRFVWIDDAGGRMIGVLKPEWSGSNAK